MSTNIMDSGKEKSQYPEADLNQDREYSHSLRTALYAIRGMVESHLLCAEEGVFKKEGERLRHAEQAMRKVHEYTDKAMRILKMLNAVCLQEDSREAADLVDVRAVWEDIQERFKMDIAQSRIQLISRIPHSFPKIRCFEKDLREILLSLLSNSLDAAQASGGRGIKIILRVERCFTMAEEAFALITFADTGCGMNEELQSRLFEPFLTTKEESKGNGLGLFMVKKLVAKNAGKIKVSSFENEGTTFTLELPLAASAPPR